MKAGKIIIISLKTIGIIIGLLALAYIFLSIFHDNINSPFEILKNTFK
jgi:hypothetical protein